MKNKNEKLIVRKGKASKLQIFMFVLCFIFLMLLVYVVGGLIYLENGLSGNNLAKLNNPDEYFKGCTLLEDRCLTADCKYRIRCGDENFEICRIYDCGGEYGIYTEDGEGKYHTKREAKVDTNAIAEKKAGDCSGDMEILNSECKDGRTEIKVKIATKGECEIGGFTLIFENLGIRANSFAALGDGIYSVTSNYCGKVSSLTPKTKDGISLELNRK